MLTLAKEQGWICSKNTENTFYKGGSCSLIGGNRRDVISLWFASFWGENLFPGMEKTPFI